MSSPKQVTNDPLKYYPKQNILYTLKAGVLGEFFRQTKKGLIRMNADVCWE